MSSARPNSRRIVVNTSALSAAGLWRIGTSFVVQVLVARRLGAAGLGGYALGMALLNVAQTVVEAGLPALLVRELAAASGGRRRAFFLARNIMTAVGLAAALLMGALAWVAGEHLWPFAALFLSLPFYGLFAATLTLFEAGERFDLVLLVDGLTNAVLMVATLVVLLMGGGLSAIFLTLATVQAASALLGHLLIPRLHSWMGSNRATPGARASLAEAGALLRRALPTFGLALTDVLQQRLDLLLVGALATPAVTGLYAAASGLVRVPVKVAQAWWRSLFPTLSRLKVQAPAQAERLLAIATRLGGAAIVVVALLLTTAASGLLTLFFGAEYGEAAPTLQLLAWSAPWYLLVARAVVLLLVNERPGVALVVSLSQVAATPLLLPWMLGRWQGPGAATATLAAAALAAAMGAFLLAWPGAFGEGSAAHHVIPSHSLRTLAAPLAGMAIAGLALYLPGGTVLHSIVALVLSLLVFFGFRLLLLSDIRRVADSLASSDQAGH